MRAICKTVSGETIALTGDAVEVLRKQITPDVEQGTRRMIPLGWITVGNTSVNFANVETVIFDEGAKNAGN